MKNLISKLRDNNTLKIFLFISLVVLTGLYVFTIPSFSNREGLVHYIPYAAMAITAAVTIVYIFLYSKFKFNYYFFIMLGFVLVALIGTILHSHQYRSWLTLVFLFMSMLILYYAFTTINNWTIVIQLVAISLFVFTCYYIFHYRREIANFRSYGYSEFRLGSYFDNPNGVSAVAVISSSFSLHLILFLKKKWKWAYILSLLTSFIVGLTTGSRTFIVAIGVIILVMTYLKFKKHKILYFGILLFLVFFTIILFSLPFMATMRDRFIRVLQTIFGTSSRVDTSTIARTIWMDYAFVFGAKNLFFGLGSYGFSIFSGVDTYSHSNISEVICDFGLLGWILFYLPLVICLVKSFKLRREQKAFVVSFVFYYIAISFSNVFYYNKMYYLALAFMYYLVFESKEAKSNEKPKLIEGEIKNIVFTCDSMSSGGAERVLSILANEFAKQGINVNIIGVSSDNPESFYKLDDNVNYLTLRKEGEKKINPIKRVFKLRKLIKSLKPDIVISFLPHVNVYTFYALFGTGIPYIVSERNDPNRDPKNKLLRLFKRFAFSNANGLVFQTTDAQKYFGKKIAKRSVVINNPLELRYSIDTLPTVRNKTILSVGRLTEQKNYKCLLDAFSEFRKQHSDYNLRIYGEGPLKEELVEYAISLGLSSSVQFMGASSNWQELEYNDAMYILSSDYEGMPNSLIEAMALGIPCISSDCPIGGPSDLIQDGYNGYLFDIGNSEDLSNKMNELVNNAHINNLVGNNLSLKEELKPEIITNKWLDYIKGLELDE